MKTAADHFAKDVRLVDSPSILEQLVLRSRWALIGSNAAFSNALLLSSTAPIASPIGFQPWKDDYSSILSILK